jgi:DinB superfamily
MRERDCRVCWQRSIVDTRLETTMGYVLTRGEVATEVDAIRATTSQLCSGLSATQFNWQPDGGRRWSIAQCLEHIARTTRLYGARLEQAIASAPALTEQDAAYANLAGRWLIWGMEPPALLKLPTQRTLQPPSTLDPAEVRRAFGDSLDYLSTLTAQALHIDASATRYANPLARDSRMFNVATGVLVMLAHTRRHLHQAGRVKAHKDFPTT